MTNQKKTQNLKNSKDPIGTPAPTPEREPEKPNRETETGPESLPGVRRTTDAGLDPELLNPLPWRVVCHNDPYTPMEYVAWILVNVFSLSMRQAVELTRRIHHASKGTVVITSLEQAKFLMEEVEENNVKYGQELKFTREPVNSGKDTI